MDIVDQCKNKLEHFRIKELKDVLGRAGLSKQGRKQDLVDKILALLYDEGTPGLYKHINGKEDLVSIIDDAYRKMQDEGVSGSDAKKQSTTSSHRQQPQEDVGPEKIRCICGQPEALDVPIQKCADPDCNIWQHIACAFTPEKETQKHPSETHMFCQSCRIKRADPFWESIAHLLYPVKLVFARDQVDSSKPFQSIEKTFALSKADKDLVLKAEYDVQVWCMLLTDSVPFRVHWPMHAELLVNGAPFRTYNRPGSQPLGANGRDDGVKVTLFLVDGVNKISLSGRDDRDFCLGVRLVKRKTLQQVMSMIPQELVGESFEDALARVKRCTGGGVVAENEDSDSDLQVVTDSIAVSLRCPMSGCRMKTAGRFKPCVHMGCFDLETFIQMNERSRKWQCPICLGNYSLESITIDPYFNRIVDMTQEYGEEISEVELKPDGSWRAKRVDATKDLSMWHYPDGSLSALSGSSDENMQENPPGQQHSALLGQQTNTCAGNGEPQANLPDTNDAKFDQQVITMSSSSSEDHRTGAIINFDKDCYDQIDSLKEEVSTISPKYRMSHGMGDHSSSADVIVLSDSDEDEVLFIQPDYSSAVHDHDENGRLHTVQPGSIDRLPVVNSTGTSDHPNKTNNDGFVSEGSGFLSINATTDKVDSVAGREPDTSSCFVNGSNLLASVGGHNVNQLVNSSAAPDVCVVNSSIPQDFVSSIDNGLYKQSCLAASPVAGNMTYLPNAAPSGDVSLREHSCWDDGYRGTKASVEPIGGSQPESVKHVRSEQRFSLPPNTRETSRLTPDDGRKRAGSPFSFRRRKRSARRRQN